jgi:hypothetical protein
MLSKSGSVIGAEPLPPAIQLKSPQFDRLHATLAVNNCLFRLAVLLIMYLGQRNRWHTS